MEEEQQLKTGPEMGSREVLVWAVAVVVLLTRSLLGWGQQGTLQWTVGLYQVTFSCGMATPSKVLLPRCPEGQVAEFSGSHLETWSLSIASLPPTTWSRQESRVSSTPESEGPQDIDQSSAAHRAWT
jgi:hypothetical protein